MFYAIKKLIEFNTLLIRTNLDIASRSVTGDYNGSSKKEKQKLDRSDYYKMLVEKEFQKSLFEKRMELLEIIYKDSKPEKFEELKEKLENGTIKDSELPRYGKDSPEYNKLRSDLGNYLTPLEDYLQDALWDRSLDGKDDYNLDQYMKEWGDEKREAFDEFKLESKNLMREVLLSKLEKGYTIGQKWDYSNLKKYNDFFDLGLDLPDEIKLEDGEVLDTFVLKFVNDSEDNSGENNNSEPKENPINNPDLRVYGNLTNRRLGYIREGKFVHDESYFSDFQDPFDDDKIGDEFGDVSSEIFKSPSLKKAFDQLLDDYIKKVTTPEVVQQTKPEVVQQTKPKVVEKPKPEDRGDNIWDDLGQKYDNEFLGKTVDKTLQKIRESEDLTNDEKIFLNLERTIGGLEHATKGQIMVVQSFLVGAKYDLGNTGPGEDGVDGYVGKLTRNAYKDYQFKLRAKIFKK